MGCWLAVDGVAKAVREFLEDGGEEIRLGPWGHTGNGGRTGDERKGERGGGCHRGTLGREGEHWEEQGVLPDGDDGEEEGSVGEEGRVNGEAGSWDSCQAEAAESNAVCRPKRVGDGDFGEEGRREARQRTRHQHHDGDESRIEKEESAGSMICCVCLNGDEIAPYEIERGAVVEGDVNGAGQYVVVAEEEEEEDW